MFSSNLINRRRKFIDRIFRRYIVSAEPLQINRAVILSKFTRYEVEKACHPELTEGELKHLIKSRGSNYESLLEHHQRHKDYEQYVLDSFKEAGIVTKLLTRLDYTDSWIEWSDVVFPVGGDGTFLLAASRVKDNCKPVIGFNSDPDHSEGFLCLNRKYSYCVKDVLQRLNQGFFDWMFRTRIRVDLKSKERDCHEMIPDQKLLGSHWNQPECSKKMTPSFISSQLSGLKTPSVKLPLLALNEVFIGERLSAQVSYFEMKVPPSQETFRVKSSGVCVSTGTGSSSWHLSMNRVTDHGVAHVLRCAGLSPTLSECQAVANKYNDSLLFDPEQMQMSYTIRDLICAGVWPSPPGLSPRGFATKLWVGSHCHDACLVIDGGTSIVFNDGSEASFRLCAQDSLRTVLL